MYPPPPIPRDFCMHVMTTRLNQLGGCRGLLGQHPRGMVALLQIPACPAAGPRPVSPSGVRYIPDRSSTLPRSIVVQFSSSFHTLISRTIHLPVRLPPLFWPTTNFLACSALEALLSLGLLVGFLRKRRHFIPPLMMSSVFLFSKKGTSQNLRADHSSGKFNFRARFLRTVCLWWSVPISYFQHPNHSID